MEKLSFLQRIIIITCLAIAICSAQKSKANNYDTGDMGFEAGTASGWTTAGDVEITGTFTIGAGDNEWTVHPADNYMARISPSGLTPNRNQTSDTLTFSPTAFSEYNNCFFADNTTNYGYIYTDISMSAGQTITMFWNYVSQDYCEYNDGVFATFTIEDGSQRDIRGLASTCIDCDIDDIIVTGSFGSTDWHSVTFTANSAGVYRLGFGAFNHIDDNYNPILAIDNAPGGTSAPGFPVLTTTAPVNITGTTATGGGNVTSTGGTDQTIAERGIVYGTTPGPIIGGTDVVKISEGSGLGAFTAEMTGLAIGQTYYVRAYAINEPEGNAGYGGDRVFTTVISVFNLSGGGEYCHSSPEDGMNIHLDGSQEGVIYRLYRNGFIHGPAILGTGEPLTWANLTGGTYTVRALAGNSTTWMNGSAVVVQQYPVSVSGINSAPANICTGETIQLNAQINNGCGNVEFHWYSDPPGFHSDLINPQANPTEHTTYYLVVSDDHHTVTDSVYVMVFQNLQPEPVTFLLPENNTEILQPKVTFSWQPSLHALHYDIYIWKTDDAVPTLPTVPNIAAIQHTHSNLSYATDYYWKVIAKNPCFETESETQTFSVAALPDLVVSEIQVPENPSTGQQIEISWTILNQGDHGTLDKTWFDAIYLSPQPVWTPGLETYLGGAPNLTALPVNTTYSNALNVTLPENQFGSLFIIIKTNAYNNVVEMDNENNLLSEPIEISLTPPPDLQVTSVIAPTIAFSGDNIMVQWTTKNEGIGAVFHKTWIDRIFLSQDPEFDAQNSVELGQQSFNLNLDPGESYNATQQVKLPQFIHGDYYIHIYTDATNTVYEHANENNNVTASSVMEIVLTPPPDLTAVNIQHLTSISNNEPFTVNWTTINQGGSPTSSGWKDKLFLSPTAIFLDELAIELGERSINTVLQPGDSLNLSLNVIAPANISGPYHLFVFTDYYDNVFELDNTDNNVVPSPDIVTVLHADLAVSNAVVASTASSGDQLMAGWTVSNNGEGKAMNTSITDKIFLTSQDQFPLVNPIQIGSLSYSNTIAPGQSIQKNRTISIPDGISGNYYVIIVINADSTVFENGLMENNYISSLINISLTPYPDLTVDHTHFPVAITLGAPAELSYRVKNTGIANVFGKTWLDALYVSTTPALDTTDAYKLWQQLMVQPLNIGSSYTQNRIVNLPVSLFEKENEVYLHAFTDINNDVFEMDVANNIASSAAIPVSIPPRIDLAVTSANSPVNTSKSGQPVNFSYTVTNLSTSTDVWGISEWSDAVYLSDDLTWDENDVLISSWDVSEVLPNGGSYSANKSFVVPHGISGNYYFLAVTDHQQTTNDLSYSNNAASLTGTVPVFIEYTHYPDLNVELFESPFNGTAGQPIKFKWQVSNTGEGPTTNPSWTDKVFLSTDFNLHPSDQNLATKAIYAELNVGESYSDSLEVMLPADISGNYILIFKTDANNNVYETGQGKSNNYAYAGIHITRPPPSDLIIEEITFDSPVETGSMAAINYKIRNIGSNPATGHLRDMIHISQDSELSADDPLFATHNHQINLAPQMTKSVSVSSQVPGLIPGNYNVLAKTNVLNNIPEDDYDNNAGISANTLEITMPQLLLAEEKSATLLNNVILYYQLNITSEYEGETMMVALATEHATGVNELYLSYESIPTRSNHDYSATESFMSNQELIVPELQTGSYYLLVYGNASATDSQQINLLASIIPFGIRSIHATTGGNTGNVTLLINGAKFENNMQIKLSGGVANEFFATEMFVISSTKLFATFNLNNAMPGMYDVIAEKPVDQLAILPLGFEIVTGTPGNPGIDGSGFSCEIVSMSYYDEVGTNVQHPARTRPNRVVAILIEYANNGNIDIPIPKRLLVSLSEVPISFDSQDFSENRRQLMLEFTEHGGPPGILRPGAQGTFTVYTSVDIREDLRFLITK